MMEELMYSILQQMQRTLSSPQLKKLKRVLEESFARWTDGDGDEEVDLVGEFLLSKEVEGRSPRTLQYYDTPSDKWSERLASRLPTSPRVT